jgi:penicillin-binding protein-related factor A (putative recombinase)
MALTETIKTPVRTPRPRMEKALKSAPTNLFGEPEKKKHNASIGNKFEKEILDTCKEYVRLELAYIQKNATPTQWIPPNANNPRGFLMHVKKTGFDFVGCYKQKSDLSLVADSWIPIFIEVKTTKESFIEIFQEKTGIKDHQMLELQWMENHGIEAYVIWQAREAGIIFKIKPSQIVQVANGKKRITVADCAEARIIRLSMVRSGGQQYLDFLNLLDK